MPKFFWRNGVVEYWNNGKQDCTAHLQKRMVASKANVSVILEINSLMPFFPPGRANDY